MFASDKALQVFNFKNNDVRVVMDEQGEPWFVAKDVAEILGYSNPRKAVADHCKVTNTVTIRDGKRGNPNVTIIPERDVYRLVMRSKLPSAERFEEWVVGEVLPSIRKHGGYLTPSKVEEALLNPDVIIRLATDLKEERARRIEAEEEIAIMAPKVDVYDAHYGKSEKIPPLFSPQISEESNRI